MDSHIVVLITASSQEEADTLSRGLVEAKLAFCVNSVPGVKSTYY
ncbi:MAG: divalent-cation tolerance protein CutA, partial [Nitrospinota bacterium]|nr:divalent-cation tolerance protein CutA [Nitrospinota bacterium]